MYANYAVWGGGRVGRRMFFSGGGSPQQEGAFWGDQRTKCNVYEACGNAMWI